MEHGAVSAQPDFERIEGFLPWFAVQVRAKHEIGIADYLTAKGYEQFLPLYKCRKTWSDRIKEVQAPLFPGYLFCRFDPSDRLPILKTPGVVQIVGNGRSPIPVCDTEIAALQQAVASGLPNQPWPFLHTGDKVQIEAGPLRGLEGVLAAFRGSRHLVLSVTLLQRSVAVEIDCAFVSPIHPPKPRPESATLQLSVVRTTN
ncbi:MAG: transcription termination/antitermination protein NusG [Candidatus Acidiferrales bacterium]